MAKNNGKKTSAKKHYSPAEKASFKRGVQTQFNREHPKVPYDLVTTSTVYNADGTVYSKNDHHVIGCADKTSAERLVEKYNSREKHSNARVMAAVKAKKVNEHCSSDCTTDVTRIVKSNRRAKSGETIYKC